MILNYNILNTLMYCLIRQGKYTDSAYHKTPPHSHPTHNHPHHNHPPTAPYSPNTPQTPYTHTLTQNPILRHTYTRIHPTAHPPRGGCKPT